MIVVWDDERSGREEEGKLGYSKCREFFDGFRLL